MLEKHRINQAFEVGQRVAYRAETLRSWGDYSHATASRRGTIKSIERLYTAHNMPRVISVLWDDSTSPSNVLECNLVRADRLHLEPA
jgi:hypothetical protein